MPKRRKSAARPVTRKRRKPVRGQAPLRAMARPSGISKEQFLLPAGFSADGKKLATLREVLSPEVPTMELTQLSSDQRATLTAERIRRQRKFELAMVGAGRVDKRRAIAEVMQQTEVGKLLAEIENRAIRMLIEKAKHKQSGS